MFRKGFEKDLLMNILQPSVRFHRSCTCGLARSGVGLVLMTVVIMGFGRLAPAGESAAPAAPQAMAPAVRILVVYHSRSGNTRRMADGVAEGAKKVPGAEVEVKTVEDVTKKDLERADAIALGCPTYFANIPGAVKVALDDWNWKWKVDFTDKVGGAFATGGGQAGGKEHVIVSLLLFMINNRMVVAGPLFEDTERGTIWGEPGAAAMTGPLDPGVGPGELDSARRLGERLARVSQKMR